MTDTPDVVYTVRDGAAWLTLNRSENRNALSAVMLNELFDRFRAAETEEKARCIVITGTGPAFCAGADLKNLQESSGGGDRMVTYPELLMRILKSRKPVIAAVNGSAFGGGLGLVGAADSAITVEDAKFAFSEVRIGVIPAVISVVCLRKLGTHQGLRLFLTGEVFTGKEAMTYGMVHKAVPEREFLSTIQSEIDAIRLCGPNALAEAKRLVYQVSELSIEEGFKRTAEWSARLFQSDEACEGIAAFREKRKPKWVT